MTHFYFSFQAGYGLVSGVVAARDMKSAIAVVARERDKASYMMTRSRWQPVVMETPPSGEYFFSVPDDSIYPLPEPQYHGDTGSVIALSVYME